MLKAAESAAQPEGANTPGPFRHAADLARYAPSILNTQPWWFRVLPESVELFEDTARSLPMIDPAGRERVISCGTPLFTARIVLAHAGVLTHLKISETGDCPAGWTPHRVLPLNADSPIDPKTVRCVGELCFRGTAPAGDHVSRLVEMIPCAAPTGGCTVRMRSASMTCCFCARPRRRPVGS